MKLSAFNTGMVFAVIVFLAVAGLVGYQSYLTAQWRAQRDEAENFPGVPAKAQILDLTLLTLRISGIPATKVTLEVMPSGLPPYKTALPVVITPANIDAFRKGAVINVLYDPSDPRRVRIVKGP